MVRHLAARARWVLTDRAHRALAAPPSPIPDNVKVAARARWVLTDRARAQLDRHQDEDA